MKKIIKKVLKEDRQKQFLNKMILLLKDDYPIYKNLKKYGFNLSDQELVYVLSGIFGEPIIKQGTLIYNENGNLLYFENNDGYWEKYEYDDNGNRIYYEDYNGEIEDYR